jgi:Cdc6-like AAA superfamily ATPase
MLTGRKVVNEESAGALGPHKVHLNTDHFKINKYSGPQDRSFLSVSAKISEMYKGWRPLIASRMSGPQSGVQRKLKFNKERHEGIVNFLAKFDFSARYSDVFLTRHKNTGQWILETEIFQQWLSTAGKTLWCPGIPGAGKTTLFAIAVNYLQERFHKKEDAILFAFCDYKDRLNQTAHNILLSLWRQLMQNRILTEAECERLEAAYVKRAVLPTTDTVLNMLSDELSKYSRVFILLDALDELKTETRDELLYLISNLPKNKNLLVTSRVPKEKTSPFSDVPQLEIRAKETDLTEYIEGRLQSSRLASKLTHNNKLKREIKDTVIKKACGM